MSRHNRLPGDAGYCTECGRFVYLPTHECETLPAMHTLKQRIRRVAHEHDIALRQPGPMWVARDTETNEQASDHTMVGAWAMLRDVEPAVIYETLADAGVKALPTPARTTEDLSEPDDA